MAGKVAPKSKEPVAPKSKEPGALESKVPAPIVATGAQTGAQPGAQTGAPKITIQDGLYMHKLLGQMGITSIPTKLTSLKKKWDNYNKYTNIKQIHNNITSEVTADFINHEDEPNKALKDIVKELKKKADKKHNVPREITLKTNLNEFITSTDDIYADANEKLLKDVKEIIGMENKYNGAAQTYNAEVMKFKSKYDELLIDMWETFIKINESIESTVNNIMKGITDAKNVEEDKTESMNKAIKDAITAWKKTIVGFEEKIETLFTTDNAEKETYKDHYDFLTTLLDKMKDKKTNEFNKLDVINKDIEQWKKQKNYLKEMDTILGSLEGPDEAAGEEGAKEVAKIPPKGEVAGKGKVTKATKVEAEAKTAEATEKVESGIKKTVDNVEEKKEEIKRNSNVKQALNKIDILAEQIRLDEKIDRASDLEDKAYNAFLNAIKDGWEGKKLRGDRKDFKVDNKQSIQLFQGKTKDGQEKELIVLTNNKDNIIKILKILVVNDNNVKWLDIQDSDHGLDKIEEEKDDFKNVEKNIEDKLTDDKKLFYIKLANINNNEDYVKLLVAIEEAKEEAKKKGGGRKSKSRKSKKRRKGRKNKTKKRR